MKIGPMPRLLNIDMPCNHSENSGRKKNGQLAWLQGYLPESRTVLTKVSTNYSSALPFAMIMPSYKMACL